MYILWLSFLAGMMTVLAPCVLPILPVILWWSLVDDNKYRPWVIIVSFACSVLLFTLLLKWLVWIFWLRQERLIAWSAVMLMIFGISLLFPQWRQTIMHYVWVDVLTQKAQSKKLHGYSGDILLWFLLWPIFNTCSPTYTILVATILPASFLWWLLNISIYILGLCLVLSLVVVGGRSIVKKLKRVSDPNGLFKKIIGVMMILLSVAILTKTDKAIESWLIENNLIIDTTSREYNQIKSIQ